MLNNASGTGDPFWSLPLHPADFFLFGYTEDVKAFFSAPPFPEQEKQYVHTYPSVMLQLFPPVLNKQLPETYLFTSFLKLKQFEFDEIALYELSPHSVATSYALLVNNFVMLSSQQLGYQHLKHPTHEYDNYFRSFTNLKWQKIYQQWCDGSHRIINEEPQAVIVPFCGVLYTALLNNVLNWQLPWLINTVLLLLRNRSNQHEKWCIRKKVAFPQGSQLRDIIRVEVLQKIVCLMLKDKALLKGLQPFMNLHKRNKKLKPSIQTFTS
jgi:WavE lipopolysaccharide synthesis